MSYRLIITYLICLLSIGARTQEIYETGFLSHTPKTTIPFDKVGGFIIIKVNINGGPATNLILDTGAENLVLFKHSKAKVLQLTQDKEIELLGSDLKTKVEGYISRNNVVQLPNCTPSIKDLIVLKEDVIRLDETLGYPIDGLLGARMFLGLVLQIDYHKQKLILTRKSHFVPPPESSEWKSIPIEIMDGKPYFSAKYESFMAEESPIKLLVDTGSSMNFLIFNTIDEGFQLSERFLRGPLGKGLGGDIMGYVGRLEGLEIHPDISLTGIITHFQEIDTTIKAEIYNERHGLIGNPILDRFEVILDSTGERLYLKPKKDYNKAFKFDLSGMLIYATGNSLNTYVVRSVFPGSPAAEADIREGDIIRGVGFYPHMFLSLSKLNKLMRREEGKRVHLRLRREGKKLSKKIRLADYLTQKK